MPEITLLGWFHTGIGITALLSGFYTLIKYKEITLATRSGQIYLLATLVTALTALGIFQHGGFGVAHVLAVLTLLALAVGTLAATTAVFRGLKRYIQAAGYSSTLLFHMIPAVTDGLLRLPVADPVLSSIEGPLMRVAHLSLLGIFLVSFSAQIIWLRKQPELVK